MSFGGAVLSRSPSYEIPVLQLEVAIIKNKVVVLHCFKKSKSKTDKCDVNLANERLKELLDHERQLFK